MKTSRAAEDVPAAPITGVTLVVRQPAHAPRSVLKGVYIQGGNEVLFSIVHFAPEHHRRAGPGKLICQVLPVSLVAPLGLHQSVRAIFDCLCHGVADAGQAVVAATCERPP